MKALVYALSEDYAQATGGFVYNQRLVAELEGRGWRISRLVLPAGFPRPSDDARAKTAALLAALPVGTLLLTDQLCIDTVPEIAAAAGRRLRLVTIVHHPLAAEGDGPRDEASALHQSEKAALRHAALVVATSHTTAQTLRDDYAVDPGRLVVAPPGSDAQPRSPGSGDGGPVALLGVGAIVPRKGHDRLVAALAGVRDLDWRLTLAGDLDRAPEHVAQLHKTATEAGLASRIAWLGEVAAPELEQLWRTADVFVSASRHEGYGMAVAEAIARGLPVITTAAGAIAEWLPADVAELVASDDAAGFAAALRRVITYATHRTRLRSAATDFRHALPGWSAAAAIVDRRLSTLH